MSLLDVPLSSVPAEQLYEHLRRLKEFIGETDQPNTVGADGQTCLRIALAFCNEPEGEERIASLLERGADPNLPMPFSNFQTYIMTAKRTEPLAMLIKAGMRLNDVYEADPEAMPGGRSGSITLLDFALDIESYLSSRGKGFVRLHEKHAGPMGPRRRFITDTIELLRRNGAVSAGDMIDPQVT